MIKNIEYIVVGLGVSGLAFAEHLRKAGKSFVVFNDTTQKASRIAGGLCNPVILKRFTLAWQADGQLGYAIPFYKDLETLLGTALVQDMKVVRRFNDVGEQNEWAAALDKPSLQPYLDRQVQVSENSYLDVPFGLGKVNNTRRIFLEKALNCYANYLRQNEQLVNASFEYDMVQFSENSVQYGDYRAKNIVFCEGFGLKQNPFFNYLPLPGTKGEYIVIKCPQLECMVALKAAVFVLPLGDDLYKIGATYNRHDKTDLPTDTGREYLEQKLKEVLKADYTVIEQQAAVRPTTNDRRPLVGRHPVITTMHVLNGMGSRGILIAPTAAKELFNYIESKAAINSEMDIARYFKKFNR